MFLQKISKAIDIPKDEWETLKYYVKQLGQFANEYVYEKINETFDELNNNEEFANTLQEHGIDLY